LVRDGRRRAEHQAAVAAGEEATIEKRRRGWLYDEHTFTGHKKGDVDGCEACKMRRAAYESEPWSEERVMKAFRR
jgi:hypothetical protein